MLSLSLFCNDQWPESRGHLRGDNKNGRQLSIREITTLSYDVCVDFSMLYNIKRKQVIVKQFIELIFRKSSVSTIFSVQYIYERKK
jgi:hypothetical protein